MLTRRQRDLLAYIAAEISAGRRPTYQAMTLRFDYRTKSAPHHIVSRLIDRGHLHRVGHRIALGPRVMWLRFDDELKELVRHDCQPQAIAKRLRSAGPV